MNLPLTVSATTWRPNIKREDKFSNIFECSLIGPRNDTDNKAFQFIAMLRVCVCVTEREKM